MRTSSSITTQHHSVSTNGSGPTSSSVNSDATLTSTPSVSPKTDGSLVHILTGVLSGVCILFVGIGVGFWLLRRRRVRNTKVIYQPEFGVIAPLNVLPVSEDWRDTEGQLLDGGSKDEESRKQSEGASNSQAIDGSGLESRPAQASEEPVVLIRRVAELVREEVGRLVLDSPNRHRTNSYNPGPTVQENTQMSEIREEIQRLRHLVLLQPSANRRDAFDEISQTTSLPAYES